MKFIGDASVAVDAGPYPWACSAVEFRYIQYRLILFFFFFFFFFFFTTFDEVTDVGGHAKAWYRKSDGDFHI
jgi:hypothetical protein